MLLFYFKQTSNNVLIQDKVLSCVLLEAWMWEDISWNIAYKCIFLNHTNLLAACAMEATYILLIRYLTIIVKTVLSMNIKKFYLILLEAIRTYV